MEYYFPLQYVYNFQLIPHDASLHATDLLKSGKMVFPASVFLFVSGFKLHMDDFGTGFSSLTSLNVLPFDVIKLDKSLIDYIGNESGDQIIQHVIALAHGLNMKVVAEGVEKKEQAAFLQNMNCDQIQGYYYSSPKSYEVFDKMI